MKKGVIVSIVFVSMVLVYIHAMNSLNSAATSAYTYYLTSCDEGSVRRKGSFLDVTVEGVNCGGPDTGSVYQAQIWDHLFWIL